MKDKQPSVDMFATYAKNYNQYKKNTATYQQKVEYIKSLYEVKFLCFRQTVSLMKKMKVGITGLGSVFGHMCI